MAALVLVLLAPGRVHHDLAGNGYGFRHAQLFFAEAGLRIQADGLLDLGDCRIGLHRLGASYVHLRDESHVGDELHGLDDADCSAQWS